jgi:hypothetical protein
VTRNEAQELATILHEQRAMVQASYSPETASTMLIYLDHLIAVLYTMYLRKHVLSVNAAQWLHACRDGMPFLLKD